MDDRSVELVEVAELVQRVGDLAMLVGRTPLGYARYAGVVWLVLPPTTRPRTSSLWLRPRLAELARGAPEGHRILIVDDSSPDGTGALAEPLRRRA